MSDESWYQLDELDDLSKEDCLADVSNILAELEIEVCDEPDIYVIDVDSQKKVKAKLQLTSELDDWTKDDECYCKLYMESRDLSILIHLINMILLQRKMLRIKL